MKYLHPTMHRLKKIIPDSLRSFYRINQRRCRDVFSGIYKKFADQFSDKIGLYPVITIEQPVKATGTSANKLHNLAIAINKLNNIIIEPGQVFSFWHLVGDPSQKNGYLKSRAIIGNILQEEIGGGLCQLSGLIYFLALRAGLNIMERHPHSMDIYTDEERFTPLGSDATVAYGYKDLRFINPHTFVVGFSFELSPSCLKGIISAKEKMEPGVIEFEYSKNASHTDVNTICKSNGQTEVIDRSRYRSYK